MTRQIHIQERHVLRLLLIYEFLRFLRNTGHCQDGDEGTWHSLGEANHCIHENWVLSTCLIEWGQEGFSPGASQWIGLGEAKTCHLPRGEILVCLADTSS